MMNQSYNTNEIIDLCVLAGKVMLENGAETYRVEDTMKRIASAFGHDESHSFSTPTAIIFSLDGEQSSSKLIRISNRSTDLQKVAFANSISRAIANQEFTVKEAYSQLKQVEKENMTFPISMQIIAAFLSSGSFMMLFNGQWSDFIWASITGAIGFWCVISLHRLLEVRFFAEFISAFIIGVVAYFLVHIGAGNEMDKITIGAVMPLVPGLLITNAVRDLFSGHLVSAVAKMADASVTALAIGAGIAIAFIIL
jgi:uncharacterized membrane protein YjjP (DUF1212 family)